MHMTDFMARRGPFTSWSSERERTVIKDALNAFAALAPESKSCVCSIDMDDHKRLKAERPHLIDENSMCVEMAFSSVFVEPAEVEKDKAIFLYFDQNEPFMRKINNVWLRRKKRPGWPRRLPILSQLPAKNIARFKV